MKQEKVKQVLNDPLGQELLNSVNLVRLAYIGLDGYPRVIPIGFYWNGKAIVICTASSAPKVPALAENPKVALTIDTDTTPPHVLLVRGTAQIEIVNGVPDEYLDAAKKSMDEQRLRAFETEVRALYRQMARITIVPEWAKLLDFETRFPRFLEELVEGKPGS